MDVEVSPENTVSGTAVIAIDESLVELSGQSADEIFSDVDQSELPEGASVEAYSEDGFVGQRITFEDVPLGGVHEQRHVLRLRPGRRAPDRP